jgi:hypothetical protein
MRLVWPSSADLAISARAQQLTGGRCFVTHPTFCFNAIQKGVRGLID